MWVNNSSYFLTGSLGTWPQLRTLGVQIWLPGTSSGAAKHTKENIFWKVGYVGDQLLPYFKVFNAGES